MDRRMWPAIGGMLVAIAITTTMDATGYTMFSALPLFPLAALFWLLQRFSRRDVGLVWGELHHYGWALAYPILVLGCIAGIALLAGAIDTKGANWRMAFINMGMMSTVGTVAVLLTEEGFFRGWLWASLERAGRSKLQVLIWSTLAFTAWHISAISLDTGFDVPLDEIPIYLVNATLIGGVFGILRMMSGSVLVPSLCHAVWNAIDYPLFGFGEQAGALGVEATHIYGPEVGVLGVAVNLVFVAYIWRKYATKVD